MQLMKNLSLKTRFLITPLLAAGLTGFILLASYYAYQNNHNTLLHLQKSNLTQIGEINRLSLILTTNHNQLNQLLIATSRHQDEEKVYINGRKILDTLFKIERELSVTLIKMNQGVNIDFDMNQAFADYRDTVVHILEVSSVDAKQASLKLSEATVALQNISEHLLDIGNQTMTQLKTDVSLIEKTLNEHQWLPYASVVVLFLILWISLMLAKRMSADLYSFSNVLKQLANGNTDVTLPSQQDRYIQPLKEASIAFKETLQQNQQQRFALENIIGDLKDSQHRIETLLDLTPNAIIAVDAQQRIVLFNQMAERLFGYTSEDIHEQALTKLFAHNDHTRITAAIDTLFSHPERAIEHQTTYDAINQSDQTLMVEMQLAKLEQAHDTLGIIAMTDVTERVHQQDKIWHQAHYDMLTQLPNRRFSIQILEDKVIQAQHHQHELAVLFMDLDDFKKINDTLGHETGDMLLVETSKRLKALDSQKVFIGRLGGDEFILLIEGYAIKEEVNQIVSQVLGLFRNPVKTESRELLTTVSIGSATFPYDGHDASSLLKSADIAMYSAKQQGRNDYHAFDVQMNHLLHRRMEIEEQISQALKNNEFSLAYQPQFTAHEKKLVGMEVLIRWHSPKLGWVSPAEFISISEQTGQIIEISEYVFSESIQQLRDWQNRFEPNQLKLSINLSPIQFLDNNLIPFINELMNNNQIDPAQLSLEVTEGVFMDDGISTDRLHQLKATGITLSLDDFGTGYSSLSYLQKYSFDFLKIDRSFVQHCDEQDSSSQQLITAIIAMAQALNLSVVAEGVETPQQLDFLKALNVELIQGYIFGKPVDAKTFESQYLTMVDNV